MFYEYSASAALKVILYKSHGELFCNCYLAQCETCAGFGLVLGSFWASFGQVLGLILGWFWAGFGLVLGWPAALY